VLIQSHTATVDQPAFSAAVASLIQTLSGEPNVLAERASVDLAPLEWTRPHDRGTELLEEVFMFAVRELAGERGRVARAYLQQRGFPADTLAESGLGVCPIGAASWKPLPGQATPSVKSHARHRGGHALRSRESFLSRSLEADYRCCQTDNAVCSFAGLF
jgi:hypothetical protein